MFGELLKQWANEQGFQTWSQDHAAVLRNLAKWLNQEAAQQSVQRICPGCGAPYVGDEVTTHFHFCPVEKQANR